MAVQPAPALSTNVIRAPGTGLPLSATLPVTVPIEAEQPARPHPMATAANAAPTRPIGGQLIRGILGVKGQPAGGAGRRRGSGRRPTRFVIGPREPLRYPPASRWLHPA